MSKIDLEPLVCLKRARIDIERGNCEYNVTNYLDTIEAALTELKEIKEAKLSEAIKCLEKINNYLNNVYDYKEIKEEIQKDITTIKQALTEYELVKSAKPDDSIRELIQSVFVIDDEGKFVSALDTIKQKLAIEETEQRVLKTIVKKNVDIWQLNQCDFERYNSWVSAYWSGFRKELAQEEFMLVKKKVNEITSS